MRDASCGVESGTEFYPSSKRTVLDKRRAGRQEGSSRIIFGGNIGFWKSELNWQCLVRPALDLSTRQSITSDECLLDS